MGTDWCPIKGMGRMGTLFPCRLRSRTSLGTFRSSPLSSPNDLVLQNNLEKLYKIQELQYKKCTTIPCLPEMHGTGLRKNQCQESTVWIRSKSVLFFFGRPHLFPATLCYFPSAPSAHPSILNCFTCNSIHHSVFSKFQSKCP